MVCEKQITVSEELTERKIDVFSEKTEQPITLRGESINVTESKDYERLYNKPRINGVELIGDKASKEIHVQHEMDEITNQEIDNIIYA